MPPGTTIFPRASMTRVASAGSTPGKGYGHDLLADDSHVPVADPGRSDDAAALNEHVEHGSPPLTICRLILRRRRGVVNEQPHGAMGPQLNGPSLGDGGDRLVIGADETPTPGWSGAMTEWRGGGSR